MILSRSEQVNARCQTLSVYRGCFWFKHLENLAHELALKISTWTSFKCLPHYNFLSVLPWLHFLVGLKALHYACDPQVFSSKLSKLFKQELSVKVCTKKQRSICANTGCLLSRMAYCSQRQSYLRSNSKPSNHNHLYRILLVYHWVACCDFLAAELIQGGWLCFYNKNSI